MACLTRSRTSRSNSMCSVRRKNTSVSRPGHLAHLDHRHIKRAEQIHMAGPSRLTIRGPGRDLTGCLGAVPPWQVWWPTLAGLRTHARSARPLCSACTSGVKKPEDHPVPKALCSGAKTSCPQRRPQPWVRSRQCEPVPRPKVMSWSATPPSVMASNSPSTSSPRELRPRQAYAAIG